MIVSVEGLWRVGKTTLCKGLERDYGVIALPEPDHLKHCVPSVGATRWYFNEWPMVIDRARKLEASDRIIVIERSPLSLVAFSQASGQKLVMSSRRKLLQTLPDVFVLLTVAVEFVEAKVASGDDKLGLTPMITEQPSFLREYWKHLATLIAQCKRPVHHVQAGTRSALRSRNEVLLTVASGLGLREKLPPVG